MKAGLSGAVIATLTAFLLIQHWQIQHIEESLDYLQSLFLGASVTGIDSRYGTPKWSSDNLDYICHYTGVTRSVLSASDITEARRYSLGGMPQMIWLEVFLSNGAVVWVRIRLG